MISTQNWSWMARDIWTKSYFISPPFTHYVIGDNFNRADYGDVEEILATTTMMSTATTTVTK